jgi:hypothetical protein
MDRHNQVDATAVERVRRRALQCRQDRSQRQALRTAMRPPSARARAFHNHREGVLSDGLLACVRLSIREIAETRAASSPDRGGRGPTPCSQGCIRLQGHLMLRVLSASGVVSFRPSRPSPLAGRLC